MRFGLSEATIAQIKQVLAHYPQVERAILYGSRAKGNYQPGSDIDLSLTGDELELTLLHQIEIALDDLLLPYKIDLSSYDQITNPNLIDHIERVGILFYGPKNGQG